MKKSCAFTSTFVIVVLIASSGCKKPVPGACVVDYDVVGSKGEACTVVTAAECKDDVRPSINMLASTKKKTFTEGQSCEAAGFSRGGCADIPIAWSFKRKCPG